MRLVNRALSVCLPVRRTVSLSPLSVCLSVRLFVCFDLFHLKMMQFVAIAGWVSRPLGASNLRATNETRTTRFPCVAAASSHPHSLHMHTLSHTHTYIYNLALVESVGRTVWVVRSLCGFQLFLYHFCLAHYAALRRQMNPCIGLGGRLDNIFTVHNFQVFIFIVYLKLLHDIFNFPPLAVCLSLSISFICPISYCFIFFFLVEPKVFLSQSSVLIFKP